MSATPAGRQRRAIGDRNRVRAERQRRHDAAVIRQPVHDRIPQRAVDEQAVEEHHWRSTAARVAELHRARTLSGPNRPDATMGRREAAPHPGFDRVHRHAGTRRREPRQRRLRGRRPVRRHRPHAVDPAGAGVRRDADCADGSGRRRPRRRAVDRRRGAQRPGGSDPPRRRVAGRPRGQRDRRLRRPRPDDRRPHRGDRRRAGQQGVAGRRRRARDRARRGHRRAPDPDRLRAHRAPSPADRRAARRRGQADHHRLRRPVQRQKGPRPRDRRGGAQPPDVADGRQDHDRLGDADEQGPGS